MSTWLASQKAMETGRIRLMRRCAILSLLLAAVPILSQSNCGEVRLHVADPAGRSIQVTVRVVSAANQYNSNLETDRQGNLDVAALPYVLLSGWQRVESGHRWPLSWR